MNLPYDILVPTIKFKFDIIRQANLIEQCFMQQVTSEY